jgi:hypothetical protein
MTHVTRFVLAASLAAALLPALAAAQLGNCGPDVEKFCKDVAPGRGRLLRCLEGHAPDLSGPCKAAIGIRTLSSSESACHRDIQKYCKDDVGDRDKLKTCMRAHAAQLSDTCKTAIIAQGD